jgi:hypothetical protein
LFAPSLVKVDLAADATVNFKGTLGTMDYYVTISNVSVLQSTINNVNAIFTFSLSLPSTFPVLVDYKTQDGTALASANDYVAVSKQTITFNVGEVTKTAIVVVKPGLMNEGEEYFRVILSNPQPAPTIKLLPDGDFGTCTIVPPTNIVFLPAIIR